MSEGSTDSPRFLVALSFPGERREFVRKVAEYLGNEFGRERVFFDEWYAAELDVRNLDLVFQRIYGEQSALVVPFFGKEYVERGWDPAAEWPAIRDALMFGGHDDGFLMTMRFDNAPIPDSFALDGYIDIRAQQPVAIAQLILDRLESMGLHRGGRKTPSVNPIVVPTGEFQYDAFISYRRQGDDKTFARDLLRNLEEDGYTVAIDERDSVATEHFLREIERCVHESRFTLCIVSPNYFQSGNCVEEAVICTVLDMGERRRRLLPLILERVKMPAWLYGRAGIDFADEDPLVDPYERLKKTLGPPS